MSLASHIALLEDPFSSGGKVSSRFLNADLPDRLGIRSAVVNRAVTYIHLWMPSKCKLAENFLFKKFWAYMMSNV